MCYTPYYKQLPEDFNVTATFLENLIRDTLEKYGVTDCKVSWNNHKSSLGLAKVKRNGTKEIQLSNYRFQHMVDKRDMVDTALHEVAHILAGISNGHNRVWKQWCIKVGALPERVSHAKFEENPEDYKYAYFCEHGHGFQYGASRKTKYNRSCGKCRPYYSEEHVLKVVQNW